MLGPDTGADNREPGRTALDSREAIGEIIKAIQCGRQLVPFLAAGISVNTGFPSMAAITTYLAKVRYYIAHVFRDPYVKAGTWSVSSTEHLREYGWPDLNRLNADIWRHVTEKAPPISDDQSGLSDPSAPLTIESLIPRAIDGSAAFRNLLLSRLRIREIDHDQFDRKAVETIIEHSRGRWARRNLRPQQIIDSQHLEMLAEQDSSLASRLAEVSDESGFPLRGDWYGLLMTLTGGDFDLIDALFVTLGNRRRPAATHAFLAQLVDLLRVRLFLTTNFDPFLERALREEGHDPAIFEVFRDADLPSPLVVRRQLSVLKLHGGMYGVRIGERIQENLDVSTRYRALDIIHEDSLILILGFSGGERRMLQLLEGIARRGKSRLPVLLWMHWGVRPDKPVSELRERLKRDGFESRLMTASLDDSASFLQELLCALGRDFPSGNHPYPSLPTRPLAKSNSEAARARAMVHQRIHVFVREDLMNQGAKLPANRDRSVSDGAVTMSRFCSDLQAHQYQVIWIDCEEHHTIEGVVADILDQVNVRDPSFPPLLMQTSEPPGGQPSDEEIERTRERTRTFADGVQIRRAAERIREALQRGRYTLCIDSPEAFGRPQTVHHGIPTYRPRLPLEDGDQGIERPRARFSRRISLFFDFLRELMLSPAAGKDPFDIGESYIAIAFDLPMPRHGPRTKALADGGSSPGTPRLPLAELTAKIAGLKQGLIRAIRKQPNQYLAHPVGGDDVPADITQTFDAQDGKLRQLLTVLLDGGTMTFLEKDDLLLETLHAFFRRPRSYLAFRSLFLQAPVNKETWIALGTGGREAWRVADLDARFWEAAFSMEKGERPLEGGLLWLARQNHNYAYDQLTFPVHGSSPWRAESGLRTVDNVGMLLRLLLLAVIHRRIARFYFSELYASSGDLAAFREYIYHRVSFLRYLANASGLIYHHGEAAWQAALGPQIATKAVLESIGHPSEFDLEGTGDDRVDLLNRIARVRLLELQSFRATLSRELGRVLKTTYSGTWLSWLDRLRDFDLKDFRSDIRNDPGILTLRGQATNLNYLVFFEDEVRKLRADLDSQEIRFLEEKADWDGALRALGRQLVGHLQAIEKHQETGAGFLRFFFEGVETGNLTQMLAKVSMKTSWVVLIEQVAGIVRESQHPTEQTLIDFTSETNGATLVESSYRMIQVASDLVRGARIVYGLGVGTSNCREHATRLLDLAASILTKLRRWLPVLANATSGGTGGPIMFSDPIREFLRVEIDRAELEQGFMRAVAAFQHANAWHDPEPGPRSRQTNRLHRPRRPDSRVFSASETDNPFLKASRDKAQMLHEMARQTVFQDQSVYNLFRARSLMLLARSDYLGGTDFSGALSRLSRASRLLAGSGIDVTLDRVAVLRARAECLLLQADLMLSLAENRKNWDTWTQSLNFAERRLALGRAALSRALRIFEGRQRNVSWWLRLTRDAAQWSIEAAILNITSFPLWKPRQVGVLSTVQRFEEVLDIGLAAIRASMDSVLHTGDKLHVVFSKEFTKAARDEWKRSAGQWLCLLAATYWHDALEYLETCDRDSASLCDDREFPDLFWQRWQTTNEGFRFSRLVNDDRIKTRIYHRFSPFSRVHNMRVGATRGRGHPDPSRWFAIRGHVLDAMKALAEDEDLLRTLTDIAFFNVEPEKPSPGPVPELPVRAHPPPPPGAPRRRRTT